MANRSRGRKSARSRSVSASASNSPMRTGGDSLVAPIISSLIAIAINAYLLDYILRLEKRDCECSNHWQRDYIKYFSIVIIVISVLMIILALSGVRARQLVKGSKAIAQGLEDPFFETYFIAHESSGLKPSSSFLNLPLTYFILV